MNPPAIGRGSEETRVRHEAVQVGSKSMGLPESMASGSREAIRDQAVARWHDPS